MRWCPDKGSRDRRLPRRATDRVEDVVAWLLTAAGLLLVNAAVVAGTVVYTHQVEAARTASETRAVLLDDAQVSVAADPATLLPARATWTDRTGGQRTGIIFVEPPARAGSQVDVWVDANGTATTASRGHGSAVVAGVATGAVAVLSGFVLLTAAWARGTPHDRGAQRTPVGTGMGTGGAGLDRSAALISCYASLGSGSCDPIRAGVRCTMLVRAGGTDSLQPPRCPSDHGRQARRRPGVPVRDARFVSRAPPAGPGTEHPCWGATAERPPDHRLARHPEPGSPSLLGRRSPTVVRGPGAVSVPR